MTALMLKYFELRSLFNLNYNENKQSCTLQANNLLRNESIIGLTAKISSFLYENEFELVYRDLNYFSCQLNICRARNKLLRVWKIFYKKKKCFNAFGAVSNSRLKYFIFHNCKNRFSIWIESSKMLVGMSRTFFIRTGLYFAQKNSFYSVDCGKYTYVPT